MAKSILRVKVVSAEALSSSKIEGTGLPSLTRDSAPKAELPVEKGIDEEAQQRKSGDNNVRQRAAWMPDPVTGNFIPEDHFGEVDIAELREDILRRHSLSKRKPPT
ncbi:protein SENESCENCE-ASSOCIATED GENE 21, mitochondrial-like isoform X2 [Cryptomeria japonica]|uniref:protein SENESCENCE-ASSOCIATED GENE 21, mitochondrial-like isoform X2 n=1 Tax=Cryptomeria japonica TaxID=3369 RepID=UPI0025AC5DE9|nr:protein SENESCENCE-ASSOCIATED GENE 21, mitochondrial-like isoform X2 [Cryptomeria japonica]